MNSLIFRNVHLRYADLRRKDESMPFARLHLTADLSSVICEAMGWEMPGDGQSDGSLIGKLTCSHLVLTPNEKGLRARELQIECSDCGDFKFVGVKDDDGEITDTELRFIVRTNQESAIGLIEQYWRSVGESDAQMKLSYEKEPKQMPLAAATQESDAEPTLIDATAQNSTSDEGENEEVTTPDSPTVEERRYPGSGNGCEACLLVRECEGGYQADYMVRFTVGTRDSRPADLDSTPVCESEHQAVAGAARNCFEFCGEIIAKHESGNTRVTVRHRNEAQKLRNWLAPFMETQPGLPMQDEQAEVVIQ